MNDDLEHLITIVNRLSYLFIVAELLILVVGDLEMTEKEFLSVVAAASKWTAGFTLGAEGAFSVSAGD